MAKVTVTRTIDVDAGKAWQAIRAIGGLDRWFPIITSCVVQGSGIGATRICGLENGITLSETVEAIDDAAQVFEYSIADSPMPVRNYRGRVTVGEAGPARAEIAWSAEFDVAAEKEGDMVAMFEGAFADGIKGLEADLGDAA